MREISFDIGIGADVTDVLIRGVPEEVVAAIEARARRLGLSRAEYLRREVIRAATAADRPVTVEDLERFSERFRDLADPEIMRGAWE